MKETFWNFIIMEIIFNSLGFIIFVIERKVFRANHSRRSVGAGVGHIYREGEVIFSGTVKWMDGTRIFYSGR